jgi:hypothetical protein
MQASKGTIHPNEPPIISAPETNGFALIKDVCAPSVAAVQHRIGV